MQRKYQYAPLHSHNEYSLLDGMGKSRDWVKAAVRLGVGALGLTNHNSMMGVIKHYKECKSAGIKPVIGAELTITKDIKQKDRDSLRHNRDLVIYPTNLEQYSVLCRVLSKANEEGFYYKPRVDWKMLRKCEGMVVTTACRRGVANLPLGKGDFKKAGRELWKLIGIFGRHNVFLEVQPQDDPYQQGLNRKVAELLKYAQVRKYVGLTVGCDSHYPSAKDYEAHNILLLIQTRKTLHDVAVSPDKVLQFARGYHLWDGKDVYEGLRKSLVPKYVREAMRNTLEIADRVSFDFNLGRLRMPHFSEDPDTEFMYKLSRLWHKFRVGMGDGYDKDGHYISSDKYKDRLKREIRVIRHMGLQDFFLTMVDVVKASIKRGIKIRARGSVAGSLVAYLLKITDVDPIKFNLLFERFLNKSRTKLHDIPDIDMDLQDNRRDEIKEYLAEHWGHDKVVNVSTFGTMGSRGVLKDVGRAYGIPFEKTNSVTGDIPSEMSLRDAVHTSSVLKEFTSKHKGMLKVALKLEGQARHIGGHAAGVVITPRQYWKYFHIVRSGKTYVSSLDMDDLKDMGLLKLDLLGSKILRTFDGTERFIANPNITLTKVGYGNPQVYKEFKKGNTVGVFQFGRFHFQQLCRAVKPKTIEDLAVITAIGRPGAKLTGQDTVYVQGRTLKRFNRKTAIPELKTILASTYGAIVFQEQVMEICNKIGGLSPDETNRIRESIKHFKHKTMASFGKKFKGHAIRELGHRKSEIKRLWKEVKTHSSYSYNKSHAVAYSILTYYSMYLKTFYPYEYMTCLLNGAGSDRELEEFLKECVLMGISLRPPHIRKSGVGFLLRAISKAGGKPKQHILEGFVGIKGIGVKTAEKIIEGRRKKGYVKNLTPGLRKKLLEGGMRGIEK